MVFQKASMSKKDAQLRDEIKQLLKEAAALSEWAYKFLIVTSTQVWFGIYTSQLLSCIIHNKQTSNKIFIM